MRRSEVALQQSVPFALVIRPQSEPLEIARKNRAFQSVLYAIELELFLRRILAERTLCLVTRRQLERHEKDERNHQHGEQQEADPLGEELDHAGTPPMARRTMSAVGASRAQIQRLHAALPEVRGS